MSEREQRAELGRFLRDRRARISPAEAGLPATPRRRVRGLRREEVASLAGIGVSWYTALENGTARGVSGATLLAIAGVLRLSDSERHYLIALGGRSGGTDDDAPGRLLVDTMHALAFPAYIITATWDVVACNAAFRRVWGIGEDEVPFNAIERLFLEPAARKRHGEHFLANITPLIAMLRSGLGRRPYLQDLQRLRDRLLTDDAIRTIWNDDDLAELAAAFRAAAEEHPREAPARPEYPHSTVRRTLDRYTGKRDLPRCRVVCARGLGHRR